MNISELDDAALIKLIAQGQNRALSILFERYNRLLFSVALAVLADRALAEEVTLDVFVRVWRRAGTYQAERGKVSTWLIAITRNHAIDVLRWYGSRPDPSSLEWEPISAPDQLTRREPEEHLELALQRERVRKAVAQLPADQRQVLALAYFRGLTHREIAESLGQPLGTVKTRIRLAMQKLRQVLSEE